MNIIIHEYGLSPKDYKKSFDDLEHFRIEQCPNCESHKRLYLHSSYDRYVIYHGKSYPIKIMRHSVLVVRLLSAFFLSFLPLIYVNLFMVFLLL